MGAECLLRVRRRHAGGHLVLPIRSVALAAEEVEHEQEDVEDVEEDARRNRDGVLIAVAPQVAGGIETNMRCLRLRLVLSDLATTSGCS
jgi:hypothetical protein